MASIPDPQPGLVIGYAYLWRSEALRGREEGVKDRPCVIILSVKKQVGAVIVTVAPVTHSKPLRPQLAIEIPPDTKRRLGLDGQRSWIALHDLNQFIWPGNDLRRVKRDNDAFSYGLLSRSLYRAVRDQTLALFEAGEIVVTRRQ